jgi:excisionase family DNA binding protein
MRAQALSQRAGLDDRQFFEGRPGCCSCAVAATIGRRKERFDCMKLLTLPEAAKYLRMSRSCLYQRKDIPRYRRPGSRVVLFDEEELEAWLKRGHTVVRDAFLSDTEQTCEQVSGEETSKGDLAIEGNPVYHRNARYR